MSTSAGNDWVTASEGKVDGLERSEKMLKGVGALLLVAGIVAAAAFAWSALSADVNLMGTETGSREGAWDWWRAGWALAAGLFSWGVLHGLGELVSWAGWDLDRRLPDRGFAGPDVWENRGGTVTGQGM